DSVETDARRYVIEVDRSRAALLGTDQQTIAQTLQAALSGYDATFIRAGRERYPIAVRLELPVAQKADLIQVLTLEVPAADGTLVPLSEVATIRETAWEGAIHHKDLLPVTYVMGDMAGDLDSPLYGMFDLVGQIRDGAAGQALEQFFVRQPADPYAPAIKWDGEWQITYETFRDMAPWCCSCQLGPAPRSPGRTPRRHGRCRAPGRAPSRRGRPAAGGGGRRPRRARAHPAPPPPTRRRIPSLGTRFRVSS